MAVDDLGTPVPANSGGEERGDAPLEWLLGTLREAMAEVMGGESTPLQKANAMARLGSLYLKAHQTAALQQENRELTRQIAEMEQRLAAVPAATERAPSGLKPAASRPGPQKLSRSRTLPPRGVPRGRRRSTRTDSDGASLDRPPDTNLSLSESDEIEITLPPEMGQSGAAP